MKKRRVEEITMQWEMAELNRLKQNKNRKYSWPGQLMVYCQTIEVTLYLTCCSCFDSHSAAGKYLPSAPMLESNCRDLVRINCMFPDNIFTIDA
jgi:hypothetical protein